MYEYSIYWIKEEIANHYFHKSDILYRFIKEYRNNQNRLDLKNQYMYVTQDFHVKSLIHHIKKHSKDHVNIQMENSLMEISSNRHYISLHIREKHLKFQSGSLQDAEELLFPVLRLFHPYLFVVSDTYQNYGWISPVKLPRDELRNQVLYSC
ncbi:sporulation inhibitor of replication protein SirA [Oceanobacillus halophilus]|uniref:Sporulation inhibitor of replication protein SirA n=1 Tax=Oceanobacillus halophilus TaxID=930130 RepID=A0A495AC84_9BACI|nr:sporulation inhibitor of replication protein SirA [Oceanobacillus halophilus]RKQ37568.1 sporulation inhibitor of replication protein SirA [Oceanobacillus halophilus]